MEEAGAGLDLHPRTALGAELDSLARRSIVSSIFREVWKIKSPTREEVRRAFEPDQQLGGGELLIHIERHWEEEIAVSMVMFYQILPFDKWPIAQCSNA
jgi:hypothetical protein